MPGKIHSRETQSGKKARKPTASAIAVWRPRVIGRTSATAPAYDTVSSTGPAATTTTIRAGSPSSAAALPNSAGPMPSASDGQNRAP